jgi:hypothetical protein
MLKACIEQGCPNRTTTTRCTSHQRAHDQARGSRHQRGYDATHVRARAAAIATYDPADPCPRCRQPLGPDPDVLDLGHVDGDRSRYSGLEHRECNRGRR